MGRWERCDVAPAVEREDDFRGAVAVADPEKRRKPTWEGLYVAFELWEEDGVVGGSWLLDMA